MFLFVDSKVLSTKENIREGILFLPDKIKIFNQLCDVINPDVVMISGLLGKFTRSEINAALGFAGFSYPIKDFILEDEKAGSLVENYMRAKQINFTTDHVIISTNKNLFQQYQHKFLVEVNENQGITKFDARDVGKLLGYSMEDFKKLE